MPIALTIAGSDSGGGAGIQADLKTFAAHGVFGTSAITAITAQNTIGVTAVQALSADLVTAQIEAVAGDMTLDVVKTGMLATSAIVEAVAAAIDALDLPSVVVDPVMVAKSGDRLLEEEAVAALRRLLLPRARLVTPNVPEAEVLVGRTIGQPIASLEAAREAARRIHALGARAVLLKGGHLPKEATDDDAVDLLFDGRTFTEFRERRIEARHTHGTGCTFASAIAAQIALGQPLTEAIRLAKTYVTGAIRHGLAIGHGHGPVDHFWMQKRTAHA
jgi:hydroxymethylpyrimidine/phosphomethylpyrimidine kinase